MQNTFVPLTAVWLTLQLLDAATTHFAIEQGLSEGNPFLAIFLPLGGVAGLLAWKMLWVGWVPLVCWALRHWLRLWPALQLGIVAALVALANNVFWITTI
jgi:hypothetical protein